MINNDARIYRERYNYLVLLLWLEGIIDAALYYVVGEQITQEKGLTPVTDASHWLLVSHYL